jgi:hypothetical protein
MIYQEIIEATKELQESDSSISYRTLTQLMGLDSFHEFTIPHGLAEYQTKRVS